MRIGLLGGSFDPIHNAHLLLASTLQDYWHLDEVWFLPTAQNPLKKSLKASDKDRLEMLARSLKDYPSFLVCLEEIHATAPSYTIDTVLLLKKKYPQHEFFFLIGEDLIASLPQWKNIEQLAKEISFLVIKRTPSTPFTIPHFLKKAIFFTETPPLPAISSRDLREKIARNISIEKEVPPVVFDYIERYLPYKKEN